MTFTNVQSVNFSEDVNTGDIAMTYVITPNDWVLLTFDMSISRMSLNVTHDAAHTWQNIMSIKGDYSAQFLVSSNADGRFQIPNNVAGYRPMSVHTSDYYCAGIKDKSLLTNEYYSVLFTIDPASGQLVKVANTQVYIDVFYQRV